MNSELVSQGLNLMVYGMGTVILFLTLLVGILTLMARVIARFFPEPEPVVKPKPAQVSSAAIPQKHLSAIQKALDLHRNRAG